MYASGKLWKNTPSIVRHTNTNKAGVEEGKKSGMAPLAYRVVEHGVYCMPFYVNPNYAAKSGCTASDIELLKRAIPYMFDLTRSNIRPDVRLRHAWYMEHKNKLGSWPDYLLIDGIDAKADRKCRGTLLELEGLSGCCRPSRRAEAASCRCSGSCQRLMDKEYLAHSAHDGFPAQTYLNHVQNVHDDAVRYAKEAAAFAAKQEDDMALVSAVTNAASLHDLGKLEEENQAALHAGNQPHLPINHTDAGTALLLHENKMYSAVCVMSHHRGLPDFPKECCHGSEAFRDTDIASATDSKLPELKAIHHLCP